MQVALGEADPDLAIVGGKVVDVFSGRIREANILIRDGRIAALPSPDVPVPEGVPTYDAAGRYLCPGLIDPHMHMESSQVLPAEFAKAVVPRGVSTVVVDPHEFGNVVGTHGIRAFLDACKGLPLRVLLRVPARVPELTPDLETGGGQIDEAQTREMLAWPEAACLAGDINPEIILRREPGQMQRMADTLAAGHVISGYAPQLSPGQLDAFVAAGVRDTHVPKDVGEIIMDIEHGLHTLLTPRPGRFEEADFRDLARLIADRQIDTRRICLCTDDVLVHELITDGHLDARLRMAIRAGIDPVIALQMATLNNADLFRLDDHLGALGAGRFADIAVVSDMETYTVDAMFFEGRQVTEDRAPLVQFGPMPPMPEAVRKTVHSPIPEDPAALTVPYSGPAAELRCRVLVDSHPKTLEEHTLAVRDGTVQPDPARGILSLAVVERYHSSGRIGRGFVKGFGLERGAVASSTNHNSHHIFTLGTNAPDMRTALARLAELQGGYVAVLDGEVVAEVPLPVIGMISELPAEDLAEQTTAFERVLYDTLGCTVARRPMMDLNFLCSPVVMNYGMTDFGLVDCLNFERVDLFAEPAPA